MVNVIKVKLELANDGREYNSGSVICTRLQFIETLRLEDAKTAFFAGKEVYFLYRPNADINQYWIKRCNDIDYLVDHYEYGDVCGIILNKHMLTDNEYELINKLAGLSGMACWFTLCSTGDEYDVRDVEDNRDMSLVNGLKLLFEGISSLDDYSCTNDEKIACRGLCERLGIKFTV